jgi:hypothetical protein
MEIRARFTLLMSRLVPVWSGQPRVIEELRNGPLSAG